MIVMKFYNTTTLCWRSGWF